MTDKEIKILKTRYKTIWVTVMILIPVVLIATYLFVTKVTSSPTEPGPFGDLFGLANALFSGLAFSGIIYTIFLQQLELELTREELSKSAQAQIESQRALATQVEQMAIASRLNAYSIMIEHYREQIRQSNNVQSVINRDNNERKLNGYIKFTENALDELINASKANKVK